MNCKTISVIFIAILLTIALTVVACAAETTVTVAGSQTTITQTITAFTTSRPIPTETITMPPPEGSLTAEDAPLTPHTLLTYDACTTCHMVTTAHVEQGLLQQICATCHTEGPQILQVAGY